MERPEFILKYYYFIDQTFDNLYGNRPQGKT